MTNALGGQQAQPPNNLRALYDTKDEVDTLAESKVKAREFFA